MKTELQIKKLIALGVALLSLAACGKKEEGTTQVTSRGYGPRTAIANQLGYTPGNTASSGQLQGIVRADASYQPKFQEAVLGLLSTDVLPQYVGYVSGTGQYNSGVLFGGRVALASGSLRTIGGGQSPVASNSTFVIQVFDYVQQAPNTNPLPAFAFNRADGYVSGNSAEIVFSDAYGSITLNGILDSTSQRFTGRISYDNTTNIDSSQAGAAGDLGDFSIPICSFFVCN